MVEAERLNWRLLGSDGFSDTIMRAFLRRDDLNLPLMRQFGTLAKELNGHTDDKEGYLLRVGKQVKKMSRRSRRVQVKTEELLSILTLIASHIP